MIAAALMATALLSGVRAVALASSGATLLRSRQLMSVQPRVERDRTARFPHAVVSIGAALRRGRSEQRLVAGLPDAIEVVSRALRSGSSVPLALADAATVTDGPLGDALDRIVTGTQRGESLRQALERFVARSPQPEVRVSAAALIMAADSGGGPSRALDGVSESLRDRQRLRREISALTSQARTSAMVLIALPVVFVVIYAAIDASALMFLVHDDLGRLCLAVGLGLDVVGWLWMRRLVGRVSA